MPVVTLNDYSTMPPQSARHPFSRQCPNLRTCWPGLSATFNPIHPSRTVMFRRIAFLLILSFRLLHNLFTAFYSLAVGWGLPQTLLGILFFFFMAWNLHLIVNMEGSRTVMGRTFTRGAFDGALGAFAGCHAVLLAMDFLAWGVLRGVPGQFLWACVDLSIFGVAWVATWDESGHLVLP